MDTLYKVMALVNSSSVRFLTVKFVQMRQLVIVAWTTFTIHKKIINVNLSIMDAI